jgi:hypothetical protein
MTAKKVSEEKRSLDESAGAGQGEAQEQEFEIAHTEDIVARGESFLIIEDKGERDGQYGTYHTLLIKYEGENPLIWNTGAWQILALLERFETPILIKSLSWKRKGMKKTLSVVPSGVQKAKA